MKITDVIAHQLVVNVDEPFTSMNRSRRHAAGITKQRARSSSRFAPTRD